MRNLIIILVLIGAYMHFRPQATPSIEHDNKPEEKPYVSPYANMPTIESSSESKSHFSCDGRTHCSQMHSCAEAKYFLRNCPNTEMDGDNDGIPCERQWC